MKRYDAIIIGGGLGGLTSGLMLAKEGLSVCVLEQHHTIGGCLQSFTRNGRTLDTGMHYVGSLSEGQIMHQYFKYLGVADRLKLQKLDENGFDHFHFSDGSHFCHAMGYERFLEELSSTFPDERKGLKEFCDAIRNVGELISPRVLRNGKISDGGMEYISHSAFDEIGKYTKNATLQRVLAGNSGLYAGDRLTTSFYEYGMITHSNIEGAYAFVDGSQHLADLLVSEIKANGERWYSMPRSAKFTWRQTKWNISSYARVRDTAPSGLSHRCIRPRHSRCWRITPYTRRHSSQE